MLELLAVVWGQLFGDGSADTDNIVWSLGQQ
jgi:hypothetical protein